MCAMKAVKLQIEKGGRDNDRRPAEITEEEMAKAALCGGSKRGHSCNNPVFVCSACGNYGCAQEVSGKCDSQGFKNDKCLHCGSTGARRLVLKDELAAVEEAWESKNI